MKIIINSRLKINPRQALRSCGYFENLDHRTDAVSYIRVLSRQFYPRFHLYLQATADKLELNLHLDQKPTSYQGSAAHSGEYDGSIVEQEGERIKQLLSKLI